MRNLRNLRNLSTSERGIVKVNLNLKTVITRLKRFKPPAQEASKKENTTQKVKPSNYNFEFFLICENLRASVGFLD